MSNETTHSSVSQLTQGFNITSVLVVLLIVASFFIGSFYTKVQYLEKGGSDGAGAQVAGAVNPQAAVPNAAGNAAPPAYGSADQVDKLGVNEGKFKTCLDSGKYKERVEADYQSGVEAGITGTPGNILLDTKTGKTKLIPGALPFEQFKTEIDTMLKES